MLKLNACLNEPGFTDFSFLNNLLEQQNCFIYSTFMFLFFHTNLMDLLMQDHLPTLSPLLRNYTTRRCSKAAVGLMATLLPSLIVVFYGKMVSVGKNMMYCTGSKHITLLLA